MRMTASQLLAIFAVYGRFYEKRIAGVPEQLRDRLEIAPIAWSIHEVVDREPDLLVVMMNPGASRPLDALWSQSSESGFVPTQPDRTQYQIMHLLLAAQKAGLSWQHARVLNLSDLRTPKSAIFLEKLNRYMDDDSHSLFSKTRTSERDALFGCRTTPVLCAWGMSPQFGALAARALAAASGHPLLGLSADGLAYRHPLPQRHDLQLQWSDLVAAQISRFCTHQADIEPA